MKTKKEIRNEYACIKGYRDWEDLKARSRDLDEHIDALMDLHFEQQTNIKWINSDNNYYECQSYWVDGVKHFKHW